jgi:hypothetical protein
LRCDPAPATLRAKRTVGGVVTHLALARPRFQRLERLVPPNHVDRHPDRSLDLAFVEDHRVLPHAVDRRHRRHGVLADPRPCGKDQVRRDHDAAPLVALGQERERHLQIGGVGRRLVQPSTGSQGVAGSSALPR